MPPFTSECTFDDSKSCSSAEPQAPMKNESCYAPVERRSVTFAKAVAVLEVQHLKDTTDAEIAATWYDTSEGDHACILVQEVPGTRSVQDFNDRALQGYPLLTPRSRALQRSTGG